MPNTNFQTFHQMGNAVNDVVRQAMGRDPVQNIDMDYVTVAQNKTIGEMVITGNPASFHTGNSVPIQRLLIGMNPLQSGSGDPSPENVRPISGRTGIQVSRTGRNLIPNGTDTQNGYQNNQYIKASDGAGASSSSYYSSEYFIVSPDTVYTLYDSNEVVAGQPSIVFYDREKNFIPGSGVRIDGVAVRQITTPSNAVYARCSQRKESAGSLIQFEVGSNASTAEEYTGDVYSITFPDPPGTVYGGTLDMVNGVLTVTHGITDLGSQTWVKSSRGSWYCDVPTFNGADDDSGEHLFCSQYKGGDAYTGETDNIICIRVKTNKRIWVRDTNKNSLTDLEFKSAMSGVQLVYKLATPVTYQMTPQELNTLIGDNVIFTDGDTLEVMYYQYEEAI